VNVPVVRARDLVIDFPIYGAKSRSFKSAVLHAATGGRIAANPGDKFVVRALDHLSFEWREGDRIGLVGNNGSGKTTLLRVVAGIYEPASGAIDVQGRVASMLSITLGMDAEATGYENIFLRGTILGLRRREILGLVDEIVDFSGLGDYIHMPMRTYSSGMIMRLMFAISTSVQADIILMDEWLSVGDAQFAEKAQERLMRLIGKAKLLVIASHSQEVIRKTCTRVVRLDHGKIMESN
jgi:lipopolysaccharide transport system ATP-binding protein